MMIIINEGSFFLSVNRERRLETPFLELAFLSFLLLFSPTQGKGKATEIAFSHSVYLLSSSLEFTPFSKINFLFFSTHPLKVGLTVTNSRVNHNFSAFTQSSSLAQKVVFVAHQPTNPNV